MKEKTLIFIVILNFLYLKTVAGCCANGYLTIYPTNTNTNSNAVFLIEFQEGYFKVKDKVPHLIFTAINQKGKTYKLKNLEINFSGTNGQILLKPQQTFNLQDTISIKVSFSNIDTVSEELISFQDIISKKKWTVIYKSDKQKPKWLSDSISYKLDDFRASSAPGYSVIIYPATNESTKLIKNDKNNEPNLEMYYKVFFNNQQYICPEINGSINISYSICGSNFSFNLEKDYLANLQAIDASGNYSKKIKPVKFKTSTFLEKPQIIN